MSKWNQKRRVMRHYDQSARVYDAQYLEEQKAKITTAVGNLTLRENSLILDAGCGTGLLFMHVAGKSKCLIGADISRGILKEAKRKAIDYKNVALILADADNIPFPNQMFDAVFAITLLQNAPNPVATLNEIKRVSKSNAAIIVTGLRKAFVEEEFVKMVKQAGLKVASVKPDEKMREYIYISTK